MKRIAVAFSKLAKMLYQLILAKKPVIVYTSGVHSLLENLGDKALFLSYKKLFNQFSFVEYPLSGGRIVYFPLKLFKPSSVCIMAGGTLINRISTRSVKECVQATGNLIVFGTGVAQGYFWEQHKDVKFYSEEWVEILQKCKYIGVRGPLSKESLDKAGVENVHIVGDPVISYAMPEETLSQHWNDREIGINLGQSRGKVWGTEEKILKEYVSLAILLKKSGWTVKWYVIWPDDLNITKYAAKESETDEFIHCIYHDPLEYLNKIRDLHFFVGLKLHAVVLATCAYVPSIMVEYRPKCLDYMMSIDHADWVVRSDILNAEHVFSIIENKNDDRRQLALRLYQKISHLRKIQNIELEKVNAIIDSI